MAPQDQDLISNTSTGDREVPLAVVHIEAPYCVFVGDTDDAVMAKTGFGLKDWAPEKAVAQWRTTPTAVDLGLQDVDGQSARDLGIRSLVIGVAPPGGALPDAWVSTLAEAAALGLNIVSGLHTPLRSFPELAHAAATSGAQLIDVRTPPKHIPVGTGEPRSGRRVLTVGVDCAIGKKYAALAVAAEMRARGWNADFRATGQTGIMVAGQGIPIDTVVADFIAGAAEVLAPSAPEDHWDVIEGQGALFHPSYAGVTLGLLHGAQAEALILCTDPGRVEIDGCPGFAIPSIEDAMVAYLGLARRTQAGAQFVGISANTSKLSEGEAAAYLRRVSEQTGLPCVDPMRGGVSPIVDYIDQISGQTS